MKSYKGKSAVGWKPDFGPITSGWGSISHSVSKEQFKRYCSHEVKSLQTAIDRKSKGSEVEDSYFLEHLDKLKNYFLENSVE